MYRSLEEILGSYIFRNKYILLNESVNNLIKEVLKMDAILIFAIVVIGIYMISNRGGDK